MVLVKWAELEGLMPVLPGRRVVNMGRCKLLVLVVEAAVVVVVEVVLVVLLDNVVLGLPGPMP